MTTPKTDQQFWTTLTRLSDARLGIDADKRDDKVRAADDRTAGQFILKMAFLSEFVRFRLARDGRPMAEVPGVGTYTFVIDTEGTLVVEQVL